MSHPLPITHRSIAELAAPAAAAAAAGSAASSSHSPTSSPPLEPILRSSGVARIIQVFGNTRRRFTMKDPRTHTNVEPWPPELIQASATALRNKVEEMFRTTSPFNDPTATLEYEKHKYQHTKEEWYKIIDLALSRLYTWDPDAQVKQRNLACWLSCARTLGADDFYPHFKVGRFTTRVGKYLFFLWSEPQVRQEIWQTVSDNSWHCSHLCHNTLCINPTHMVFETSSKNTSRGNSCQGPWKQVLGGNVRDFMALYQPCPAAHHPKCLFMDLSSGFIMPKYNFRSATALRPPMLSAAGSATALTTYIEADPSKNNLASLIKNWSSFEDNDEVESSWEVSQCEFFDSVLWKVAFGNYRIRLRSEGALSSRIAALVDQLPPSPSPSPQPIDRNLATIEEEDVKEAAEAQEVQEEKKEQKEQLQQQEPGPMQLSE